MENFIVLFKDGSKMWIADKIASELLFLEKGDKFTLEGQIYDYNVVAKVLSREKYYEEYPEERPEIKQFLLDPPRVKINQKHALECMINGLKGYINSLSYRGTPETKEILNKWELRLTQKQND